MESETFDDTEMAEENLEGLRAGFSPNLPDLMNFVPFDTMRYSVFDINLMRLTFIKFV